MVPDMRRSMRGILNQFDRLVLSIAGWLTLVRSGCDANGKVTISRNVRLRTTDGGTARLGHLMVIDRFADITVKRGILEIGARSFIGQYSVICARQAITIGADCLIAEHVTIRDQDHCYGSGLTTAQAGFTTSPITIGNNVWIGAKVTITKGVTIGDNSVIGANSVVTRDIPAGSVAFGVPARVIRTIEV